MSVLIYGKDNCGECAKAEMLCKLKSLDFKYKRIGVDISLEDLAKKIGQGIRTAPQIFFVNENNETEYVGGYQDLRAAV